MTRALALAALVLLSAGPGHALVYQVETFLSLRFANLGGAEGQAGPTPGLATIHTSGSGSSHLSTITLPQLSLVDQAAFTGATFTAVTAIRFDLRKRPDLQGGGRLGNLSGAAGAGGALSPGTLPSTGGVTICLLITPLPPCAAQLPLSVGATQAGQWVGSGVGGMFEIGSGSSIRISFLGAPFEVGTVSAVGRTANGALELITSMGFAHGPASLSSSTAQTGGVVQVVTANRIDMRGMGATDFNGSITRIRVDLVPEPRLLVLLGTGALAVAWVGRSRSRP